MQAELEVYIEQHPHGATYKFLMGSRLLLVIAGTAITAAIFVSFVVRHLIPGVAQSEKQKRENTDISASLPEPSEIAKRLATALPECVVFPRDDAAYKNSLKNHWALQETRVAPSCFLRPRNAYDVARAVKILKDEFDSQISEREKLSGRGLFAVRGGGHSPVPGAASIDGGISIDLGLLNQVIPSDDGSTVSIGAGAKWMDVSKVLDSKGLAIVGGRNSAVGVAGLTLGGELAFHNYQHKTIFLFL